MQLIQPLSHFVLLYLQVPLDRDHLVFPGDLEDLLHRPNLADLDHLVVPVDPLIRSDLEARFNRLILVGPEHLVSLADPLHRQLRQDLADQLPAPRKFH